MSSLTQSRVAPAPDMIDTCRAGLAAAESHEQAARVAVSRAVTRDGRIDPALLDGEQHAVHGYAWVATYVEALRQMLGWAERLDARGSLGERESLILECAFGEYLAQLAGGLPMSQVEMTRPRDFGLDDTPFRDATVAALIARGTAAETRRMLAALIADGNFGDPCFDDDTLAMIRDQFRRFADQRVAPYAHDWHRSNALIPDQVIAEMAELGVFGLTAPEEYGGAGLGKVAMCVVTEELSRGYLGVGSLATRSEIAAELLRAYGTEEQRQRWLAAIVDGSILPAALFTEPDTGSDLANLKTRAVETDGTYRIVGGKTWSTHAARADLMTLLARTGSAEDGHGGLSMFFAPKPRGTDAEPFPAAGMSGSEIAVLGYRGMREYEVAFDGFEVEASCLLGGVAGQGFKQLMGTFETARVQTAARAIGVAQNALDLGLAYAQERKQFGRPIYGFPRISDKLAWMAVETMVARQLAWFAGREKDADRRCDLEAGMAKLLGARVAWSNADNSVQIHGGNGYAEEYPISRVLLDSRVLNVFEGTGEIQAQIIARRRLAAN